MVGSRVSVVVALLAGLTAAPAFAASSAPASNNPLQPFETHATQALLVDAATDTVLFAKAPDDKIAPAGLAKLMTMAVVFDALKGGELHLDDTFKVSENAWRKGGAPAGGTTMFAKLGSTIKVRDLIRGAIIQAANDACIVLAEGIAGNEAAFVTRMNTAAQKLGLTHSHFTNSTGLPDADQYVTARDLATLARHLVTDFPDYYPIYKEPAFTWNGINQSNRNSLVAANVGADGLGAGGTDQAGYGLAASAVRDGQRLVLIENGTASDKDRADEAKKLLDWGFRSFEKVGLYAAGDVVAQADVFGGERPTVGLALKAGLDALLPKGAGSLVAGRVVYQGPVRAPIAKGQAIGMLEVRVADQVVRQAPLYAASDVGIGALPSRAADALHELVFGWIR